jgi:hypothetical protein
MLKQRILSTLHFFDLQEMPLTLFELEKFLLGDIDKIKNQLSANWEVAQTTPNNPEATLGLDEILTCLVEECAGQVEEYLGYYFLPGREDLVKKRLDNYYFGIFRERRINRYLGFLRHMPFIRGVAIGGSQALGVQKAGSDIDLLIITAPRFLWLTRTLVSIYFQIVGLRRHGNAIANRFCLNHYLAMPKAVDREKNLYKAMEYLRLRPKVYPQNVITFQKNNSSWLKLFFPNAGYDNNFFEDESRFQALIEKLFNNSFGRGLDKLLKFFEKPRIKQDEFTFVLEDELSFHPHSQHPALLERFFKLH